MRQSRAGADLADHLNTTQICIVSEWEVTSGRGSMNARQADGLAQVLLASGVLEGD
jgi:hypothetical protein